MAPKLLSIVVGGDSHAAGYGLPESQLNLGTSHEAATVAIASVPMMSSYDVMDLVVTYPDGRTGLNPWVEGTIAGAWPGIDRKGRPITPGVTICKHLVLSFGTSLSCLDPALSAANRFDNSVLFPHGFDFVLPREPELPIDPMSSLLPVALIGEIFETALSPLRSALPHLAEKYPGRLWLLGSPPPPENNSLRLKLLRSYSSATSKGRLELPSAIVSLKLWLLVTELVRKMCLDVGCRFIDCAPVACAESKFMHEKYLYDGIHGNKAYVQRMAGEIISAVAAVEFAPKQELGGGVLPD